MVAVEHTRRDHGRNLHPQDANGIVKIFLVFAAVLGLTAFFWDGMVSLGMAWSRPEYSYGPMVPLITAYITLLELHHHPVTPNRDSKMPGIIVVALGLLFGLLGNISQIPPLITYGFIIVLGGLVLILAGSRQGLRFWPGWLHLFFMAPLPSFVYYELSLYLQAISSELGVEIIYRMGVPVHLDGNIIDLGIYKLQVAEACSGLRYLFPLLSFGWLFAVLYKGPNWHRIVLFLSTIPITVLMNSFRIGMIGLLVSLYGTEQAEGFLHYFEGWVIFITCILVLYIEAWLLLHFATRKQPHARVLDIDFSGILAPLSKISTIPVSRPLFAACALILVSGVAMQWAPSRTTVVDREVFATFPMQLKNWSGRAGTLEPSIERILGADDYLVAGYESANGYPPVDLFMSYYDTLTQGSGIHSPAVCLPAGGWEFARWDLVQLSIPSNTPVSLKVNRAVIQKGADRRLVYYWFEQRGRRLTNDYEAKFYTLFDTVIHGRSDGSLVRVITPIGINGDLAAAEEVLQKFLTEAYPLLSDYIPGL